MTTRIIVFDHGNGQQTTIEVVLPRKIIIERLRAFIGSPTFELWDTFSFAYCRFDAENIILHLFGEPYEESGVAFRNQLFSALERRVIA